MDRLANRGKLIPGSGNRLPLGLWDFFDDFIEDGSLVSIVKIYRMENGKTELILDFRESITPDDYGNIMWNVELIYREIKITKVMWAIKEHITLTNVMFKAKTLIKRLLGQTYPRV